MGRACPVSRHESKNASKAKPRQQSRMQNRTRALTALLLALVTEAIRRRDWSARQLAAAQLASHGQRFVVDGSEFELHQPPPRYYERDRPSLVRARIISAAADLPFIRVNRRGLVDITAAESDGFWAWAVIETLRHTGIRVEELLELTQLSLRHYTAATTGTLVPLLHIVPSKNDLERLIPMTPELVTVLVAVQRRAKGTSDRIPLSVRYDPTEKLHGEPFPHLFVRRIGARNEVLSPLVARRLLVDVAASAGLRDAGDGTERPTWTSSSPRYRPATSTSGLLSGPITPPAITSTVSLDLYLIQPRPAAHRLAAPLTTRPSTPAGLNASIHSCASWISAVTGDSCSGGRQPSASVSSRLRRTDHRIMRMSTLSTAITSNATNDAGSSSISLRRTVATLFTIRRCKASKSSRSPVQTTSSPSSTHSTWT
jgi:integrase